MANVGKSTGAFGGPRVTALVGVTFALAALVSSSVARAPPPGAPAGARARAACFGSVLGEGVWTQDASACVSSDAPAAGCDDRDTGAFWSFDARAATRCGARAHTRKANAFAGERVLVVGDSIARHVYASVLRLAARDPEAHALSSQEKHRDWTHALVDGGVAAFRWAPFARNVTATLRAEAFDSTRREPSREACAFDIVILGATLWDALHVRSVESYARDLRALAALVAATRSDADDVKKKEETPFVFWLAAPRVRDDALTDPAKRTHMTDEKVHAYGEAARRVPGFLLRPEDARREDANEKGNANRKDARVAPVDVGALAAGCAAAAAGAERCSADGVHAARAGYDAAAQIIANVVARGRAS